jgi:hypothetical protein
VRSENELKPSLATPALESTVQRLQTLAEDGSVQLRVIETDPRDEDTLREAAERLDDLGTPGAPATPGLDRLSLQ